MGKAKLYAYVFKRDGKKTKYVKQKIADAITKANNETSKNNRLTNNAINKITEKVQDKIILQLQEKHTDSITVEDIQNLVESELISFGSYEIAKRYIIYRFQRSEIRERNRDLAKKVMNRANGKCVVNSNANVDEKSFSGREKEAAADVAKSIAIDYGGLSEITSRNHKNMKVYQHDLEKAIYGIHNCLFLDFQNVFKGFVTKNADVRPPKSFSTACQLVAVAYQIQSQVQFGGVATVHLDYDLAPYVDLSFKNHYFDAVVKDDRKLMSSEMLYIDSKEYKEHCNKYIEKYLKRWNLTREEVTIDNKDRLQNKYYKKAMYDLLKEARQSCEALFHNLNTLESRAGSQVPFTSINLGRDTSTEGRLVTKWILEASINGIGKNHNTSIFPISIFSYKSGVNANPEDPNYDLKRLAIKSMSKRIYPNFANGNWTYANEDPDDIDTIFATMGCRTLIGYDINGLGNKKQGRGNAVPNTIILPKLGIEYGICLGKRDKPDLEGFWKAFEETLSETEFSLLERFAIIAEQSPDSAPFMYKNGTAVDTDKNIDNVYETMKHFTLAIGYIGVAEMCQALFGKDHTDGDEEVYDFALSVVRRINTFAKEATARNRLNFGCYATPAESLCYTAVKALRKQYGIIPNVTDRDFLTNSHHVPVWKTVSIIDKLKLEAPFTKYPTSGCITYVELESSCMDNMEGIEDILDYAFNELDIPYLAFNFPIDTCQNCGYQGEMNDECPICGSKDIIRLRRVTGYITTDYKNFNQGKICETDSRYKQSNYMQSEMNKDYSFLDKYFTKGNDNR